MEKVEKEESFEIKSCGKLICNGKLKVSSNQTYLSSKDKLDLQIELSNETDGHKLSIK